MNGDTPREPVHDDRHYVDSLIRELRALPPGALISARDLSGKFGLQCEIWLTVALAAMAEEVPILTDEGSADEGWLFGLARNTEQMEGTVSRVIDQLAHLSAALAGLDQARVRLREADDGGKFSLGLN